MQNIDLCFSTWNKSFVKIDQACCLQERCAPGQSGKVIFGFNPFIFTNADGIHRPSYRPVSPPHSSPNSCNLYQISIELGKLREILLAAVTLLRLDTPLKISLVYRLFAQYQDSAHHRSGHKLVLLPFYLSTSDPSIAPSIPIQTFMFMGYGGNSAKHQTTVSLV